MVCDCFPARACDCVCVCSLLSVCLARSLALSPPCAYFVWFCLSLFFVRVSLCVCVYVCGGRRDAWLHPKAASYNEEESAGLLGSQNSEASIAIMPFGLLFTGFGICLMYFWGPCNAFLWAPKSTNYAYLELPGNVPNEDPLQVRQSLYSGSCYITGYFCSLLRTSFFLYII